MHEPDVYTVHPIKSEGFQLSLPLFVFTCLTCYRYFRTVNDNIYSLFKETLKKNLGFLDNDDQYDHALREASTLNSPKALCKRYAVLLMFCGLQNPHSLWDIYLDSMCLDILIKSCFR